MLQQLSRREYIDRRVRLDSALPQIVAKGSMQSRESKKIVYVMTHVSVCGGVKIIFEHANRLVKEGWDVTIVSHYSRPEWFPIYAKFHQIPFGIELAQGIPVCDVIVATYWDHIQACIETGIAPVVYFEQGDEHLFHIDRLPEDVRLFAKTQLELPRFIMTVSNQAAYFLEKNFGRESQVVPNAIDHEVFNNTKLQSSFSEEEYILMMGSAAISFKGIDIISKAFQKVKEKNTNMKLFWITPTQPQSEWIGIADQTFVNPPQDKIAELFQNALVYVSASAYESFSLPVLEAMATGCPVISTNNDGVKEYGEDGVNLIYTAIGDEKDLVDKLNYVLNNQDLLKNLSENGLRTAEKYKWDRTIQTLVNYLNEVATFIPSPKWSVDDWDIKIKIDCFLSEDDRIKFQRALDHASEDEVYIPVIYDWIENHPITRWEIAAVKRIKNSDSSARVNAILIGDKDRISSKELVLGEGIRNVISERYDIALDFFVREYSSLPEEWKMSCTKWIILCLIELRRDGDALNVIKDALTVNPYFTDVYYLYYLLLTMNNSLTEARKISEIIHMLGEDMRENEWFFNLKSHIEENR
ncbi:glycosyltransferase family 4 protein [Paenibacillus sp. NPDC058910]|uniref:glycosyltransferase family 4 protein n=1 Tax=unclassified Paenibacillus TaxID=185978 RepID=UPI00368B3A35